MSGDLMATILWMSNKNFVALCACIFALLLGLLFIGFLFDWDLDGIRKAQHDVDRNGPVLNGHNPVNRSGTKEHPRHRGK